MRILQVINSLGTGGAERLILETTAIYQHRGVAVDVLVLWNSDHPFTLSLSKLNVCKVYVLKESKNIKDVYNPLNIFKIRKIMAQYDVVHAHLFPTLYFVALANIGLNKKLIFTEHSTGNSRMNKWLFNRLDRWIYSFYTKIVCITSEVRKVLFRKLNIPSDKLLVIENGINLEEVEQAIPLDRKELSHSNLGRQLIMVAGFRVEKDQDTVIRALSLLPDHYNLILVGDGDRREILEKLIASLNIKERVNLLGIRADVYSLIKCSDVAILSSHREGFGLTAVESMACGIPLVASRVEGLSQVVEGGGLLFEQGNAADLAEKILSLQDEKFYDAVSVAGKKKSQQYDISTMVQKHIALYEEVLSK